MKKINKPFSLDVPDDIKEIFSYTTNLQISNTQKNKIDAYTLSNFSTIDIIKNKDKYNLIDKYPVVLTDKNKEELKKIDQYKRILNQVLKERKDTFCCNCICHDFIEDQYLRDFDNFRYIIAKYVPAIEALHASKKYYVYENHDHKIMDLN